jgi:hypothetical protein
MDERIQRELKQELQTVYGNLLSKYEIEYGDIDPLTLVALEEAEDGLGLIVSRWIRSLRDDTPCDYCSGDGKMWFDKTSDCPLCKGRGFLQ